MLVVDYQVIVCDLLTVMTKGELAKVVGGGDVKSIYRWQKKGVVPQNLSVRNALQSLHKEFLKKQN